MGAAEGEMRMRWNSPGLQLLLPGPLLVSHWWRASRRLSVSVPGFLSSAPSCLGCVFAQNYTFSGLWGLREKQM